MCQILLSIVLVSFVCCTIKLCIYWEKFQSLFHFCFGSPIVNMLQQLEIRKRIVKRNCLIITSNTQIIPAMIFRQLSRLSRYIQSYYMPTSTQIYLDIETNFNHQLISLTPDLEASKLDHNVAYGARRETSFFAPYNKGSLFWNIFNLNSGNYILYLYKFKI